MEPVCHAEFLSALLRLAPSQVKGRLSLAGPYSPIPIARWLEVAGRDPADINLSKWSEARYQAMGLQTWKERHVPQR